MPFEEVQHTADWSLRVWAPTLPDLFADSARGMSALAGIRLAPIPRFQKAIEFSAPDNEGLLVSFLSELLYLAEESHLGFDEYEMDITEDHLVANVIGSSIIFVEKSIKAVTYHNLCIRESEKGFEVEIVFDV